VLISSRVAQGAKLCTRLPDAWTKKCLEFPLAILFARVIVPVSIVRTIPLVPMCAILDKFNNARTRAVSLVDAFVEVIKLSATGWVAVAVFVSYAGEAVMRLLPHLSQVFTWRSHVELMEFWTEELRQLTDS